MFNEGLAIQIKRKRQNSSAHFGAVTMLRHDKKYPSIQFRYMTLPDREKELVLITLHTFAGIAFGEMTRRLWLYAEVLCVKK